MRKIYSLFAITLLLASCGGKKEQSVQDVVASNDLAKIREKKASVEDKIQTLTEDIKLLNSKISELDTNKKVPLITVLSAKEEVFNHYLELQGNVQTKQNVLIYPEMPGQLVRIYVKEGQQVRKGQALAKIDDGGLSNQLAQVETQAALAETTYKRQKRLWEQKIGSEIQYLQAKTNYEAQTNAVNQLRRQLAKSVITAPFSGVIDDVIKEQGTVDKFIGDAIMAYWNAPGNVENHADRALIATLKQLHLLKDLNKKLRLDPRFVDVVQMSDANGVPIIDIGIGLNTGMAIAGEMGSSQRSDYTVIGDPINLGARLESLCKYYGSRCNISNFTKIQLTGKYIFRYLDLVIVKGKSEPVEIWQVIDFDDKSSVESLFEVSREELDEELFTYHKALDMYQNGLFSDALIMFQKLELNEKKTNTQIYKIYIERCEHYIEMPPENFNGVFVHTTKG